MAAHNNYVKVLGRVKLLTGRLGAVVRQRFICFDDTSSEDILRAKEEADSVCKKYQVDKLIAVTSSYKECPMLDLPVLGESKEFDN